MRPIALTAVTYAIPGLAHAYQVGQSVAMTTADSFFTRPRVAMFFPAVLVPVDAVLVAIAVWRSARCHGSPWSGSPWPPR